MPLLLLLLTAPAAEAAPEARVEVAGVGSVSLADAMATCISETPMGEIRAAQGSHRVAAFQGVAQWLLDADPADRDAYLGLPETWPLEPTDVSYQPPLDWVPGGLIGACEAAGTWWVQQGIALSEPCPHDRRACIARLTPHYAPEDARVVRRALRAARKHPADDPRDPFFVALGEVQESLDLWSDPLPYLQKACDLPQAAAESHRFIDRDDLAAARRACIQIDWLIHRVASAPEALPLECDSPWRQLDGSLPGPLPTPGTDLALTAEAPEAQARALRDRLHRMDPSPASCGGLDGWASVWRSGLAQTWRAAQRAGACDDPFLALPQRLRLCPDLLAHTQDRCATADAWACKTAGQLHLDGLVEAADPDHGVSLTLQACVAGRVQGCAELHRRTELLDSWFAQRILAARAADGGAQALQEALTGLLALRSGAEGPWSQAQAERLFHAAVTAQNQPVAHALFEAFEADADPAWTTRARAALARLPAPPPLGPENDEG